MLNFNPIFQFDVTVRDFHFCTLGKLGFEMKEVFASRHFQHSPLPHDLQQTPRKSRKQINAATYNAPPLSRIGTHEPAPAYLGGRRLAAAFPDKSRSNTRLGVTSKSQREARNEV